MKESYRKHHLFVLILSAMLMLAITSCNWNGQGGKTDQELDGNEKKETQWVDPLFEIEGQLCQHLRVIYQDKRGDLWFGTNVYGIMRYNGDTLAYFNDAHGFADGRVTGILEDDAGILWIGSSGGLTKYDGESFTKFTEEDGLINHEIWSMIIDSQGLFWIGTMEGISRFNGETFSVFEFPKAMVQDTNTILSYNRVSAILEDSRGTLWFGTDGFGITRYDPSANGESAFTHFTKANGLPDNNIADIFEDKSGNIWIGTMFGGISRYDGISFQNLNQDGILAGTEGYGFYEDKNDDLWFAVEHQGVYKYDGKAFTNYNKKDGLLTGGVICIYEDREDRFWLGGWLGLFRFDGERFFPVTNDGPWD